MWRLYVRACESLSRIKAIRERRLFLRANGSDVLAPLAGRCGRHSAAMAGIVGVSRGVDRNLSYPAGMSISFETDATCLRFCATYARREVLDNMSPEATSGFDLYRYEENAPEWIGCFFPGKLFDMRVVAEFEMPGDTAKYLLYLPPYASVETLELVVEPQSARFVLLQDENRPTIAFYGSSITQGCAASRPGLSYPNRVGRELGCSILNYGFSESALGETEMARALASAHAAVYVIEYDHNATVERLADTYVPFCDAIRMENPEALMVLMSRLSGGISVGDAENELRRSVIRAYYESRQKGGPIALIDNDVLPLERRRALLADDRHPNDEGMAYLASEVVTAIRGSGALQ